jgi:rare lipoprotein A
LLLTDACATAPRSHTTTPAVVVTGDVFQRGQASYYDNSAGRETASGEIFDETKLTAAHRSLPFGTVLLVTNDRNGLTVQVRVNDRGPFTGGRVLDLSLAAAKQLKMLDAGVVPVTIRVIKKGK